MHANTPSADSQCQTICGCSGRGPILAVHMTHMRCPCPCPASHSTNGKCQTVFMGATDEAGGGMAGSLRRAILEGQAMQR